MTIAFNTEKLVKQFSSKKAIFKAFGSRAKKLCLRLDEIADAKTLEVLEALPALNCRPLTNNVLAQWVLNVTPGHVMIFLLDHDEMPMNDDGSINKKLVTRLRVVGFIP